MLTDKQIDCAKKKLYRLGGTYHEHNDCIRIAYEWLDAQLKTKGLIRKHFDLKHIIEAWAGRYVSQDDVELAAFLHPDVRGRYPKYNINSKLVFPSQNRLISINEALKHPDYTFRYTSVYNSSEDSP